MTVSPHTIAILNLLGLFLGLLGGLYLAYDLVGGLRGPLGTITRAVTYSVLFGATYALPLVFAFGGQVSAGFGIIGGCGLGLTLGIEYRHLPEGGLTRRDALRHTAVFALLRGLALGFAAGIAFDPAFGMLFGTLTALALLASYRLGASPTQEFKVSARPAYSWARARGTIIRGVAAGLAAGIAVLALSPGVGPISFGIIIGLVVAVVGAIVGTLSPMVEYWAEILPPRSVAVFGIALLLIGLLMQSVQSWLVLFNVPIR